ncbi:MAG: hypothetical protein K6E32_02205, partial [Lachnospiraceae bacterium]|nr:hypothetical protein [Lachnospiraceae bacterium]
TGVEESFEAGESALIRGNETISEFVPGNYKGETWILDYPNLPVPSVERLIELLDDGSLIPADFEHEHVLTDWEVTKEPACETEGTRIKKCTLCGRVVETESIEATGHSYGDWVIEKEPGCETEGTRVKKCENCGKVSESETIKATGHKKSSEWTITVEPGCDTKGTKARLCENCGKEMETKTVKAAGHKYSEWKTTKEATCKERGAKERVCERCGKVDSSATSALGHDWQTVSQQNATCTAAGHKEEKCSRCGETNITDTPALGHSYSLVETMTAPTCVSLGTGRYECSRCHNTYEGDIPTNPDNHRWSTYHEQQVPDPDNPDQMITGWVRTCTEECGASEVIFFNPYN